METTAQSHAPVALVPAYQPDPGLLDTVRALLAGTDVQAVYCVNDGSAPEHDALFEEMEAAGATVIRHYVNLGKGMALRTGLNALAAAHPQAAGVVTFDADGQHLAEDIVAVARTVTDNPGALVLGCRRIPKDAPLRSRFGNALTRKMLRFFTGLKLSDTQTGLRGIPLDMVPELLRLKGMGYDFELDMLMCASHSRSKLVEVPIQTIYINGNASSHFSPLIDSMKIYFVFVRFSSVSITTALIDYAAFAATYHFGDNLLAALVTGRLIGAAFQFAAAHSFVFHEKGQWLSSSLRYLLVLLVLSTISYFGIDLARSRMGVSPLFSKWVVESVIFTISFLLQRDFVFAAGPRTERA